jgi:hypothetical protein
VRIAANAPRMLALRKQRSSVRIASLASGCTLHASVNACAGGTWSDRLVIFYTCSPMQV